MKTFFCFLNRPKTILAAVIGLFLVSWSPTSPDFVVSTGPTNTTGGYTDANTNITAFRGFLAGSNNKVGTGSSSGYAIVTGSTNIANAWSSVVAGAANSIATTATDSNQSLKHSGIFGSYNTVPIERSHLLVSGYSNSVNAFSSFVSGSINTIEGVPSGSATSYSAAIGLSNHVMASSGWAIGQGNIASGDRSVAVGTGTAASNSDSAALGRYNAAMETDDVLVVGNGTSDTTRSTALRVTADGSVILGHAQGDISMGNYE